MKIIKNYNIEKYKGNSIFSIEDEVIVEYPLTIYVNDKKLVTLYITPRNVSNLIIGNLYSSGIINEASDIESINFSEKENRALVKVNRKSGKEGIEKRRLKLDREDIYEKIYEFENKSDIFKKTGAAHLVALASNEKILEYREDVSRNNALDKIIGYILEENIDSSDKYLILSCRISKSIMEKIIRIGIRTVISVAPPTSMAIDMARENDINLIGFARDKRFNLYNNESLEII